MKRKNPLSANATRGDLLTLENKLESKLNGLEQRLDGKFQQYKDEVMTKLDDISGQLEDLQQDKTLSIHQSSQLREEVEDHEKRITLLESAK